MADSRKVQGHCPACGWESLTLAAEGHVTCGRLDCPRPDAASVLLGDSETQHVVVLGEDEFTIRHPLIERLDDALLDCQLHADLNALAGPPRLPGRYRVPAGGSAIRAYEWEALR